MNVTAPAPAEAHNAPPGHPLPAGSVPGNNPTLED
jgi:hypothetical protein